VKGSELGVDDDRSNGIGKMGVREIHVDQLGALLDKEGCGSVRRLLYFGIDDVEEPVPRDANAQAHDPLIQSFAVIAERCSYRLRIRHLVTSDRCQHQRDVLYRTTHRTDVVQRPRLGHHPRTRHEPEGRLQASDPTEGGGYPDRATRVGADRQWYLPRRQDGTRSRGGRTGGSFEVPGVVRRAEEAVV
jgi:hypothetical protein